MIDLRPKPPIKSDGTPVFSLDKAQQDGAPLVALQGRLGSEVIYATHNLCDETTWYNGSIRVTSASLIQSGSIWYHSGVGLQSKWIDLKHGKVFDEEGLIEDQQIFANANGGDPHGYSIEVIVDGVVKQERQPFATSGGDYVVNYHSGTIEPVSEDWTGLDVTASFSHAGSSIWYLEPLPNKVLVMENAEVQFSDDIIFHTGFVMGVEGYASIFAPQLIQSNGGPLPDNARITLEETHYKTIDQVIDEAIMAFPQIPPMGGTARGFTKARNIFQFHYGAVRKLYSSLGMRVSVTTEGHVSFGGERATATFYCTSQTDPGFQVALQEMDLI